MAKYRSATRIRGQIGDMVYTDGKNGPQVRMAPQFSAEQLDAKRELPLMQKTRVLNRLASGLHKAAEEYAGLMRSADFFHRVQKRFHAQKTDEPILLLHSLRDLEANPAYTFAKNCGTPRTELVITKSAFDLKTTFDVRNYSMRRNNSFYLEMILFIFSGDEAVMRTESMATPWMRTNEEGKRQVSMKFKRKAGDRYYLLACRCVFGTNCFDEPDDWSFTRMRFIDGDALRVKDKQRIEDHKIELRDMEHEKNAGKAVREVKRVEMKDVK